MRAFVSLPWGVVARSEGRVLIQAEAPWMESFKARSREKGLADSRSSCNSKYSKTVLGNAGWEMTKGFIRLGRGDLWVCLKETERGVGDGWGPRGRRGYKGRIGLDAKRETVCVRHVCVAAIEFGRVGGTLKGEVWLI